MTFEGFIIGMTFVGFAFLAMWALGNIGLPKARKKHVPFNQRRP